MTVHVDEAEARWSHSARIDLRPYEVRIDGARKGRFEELRDAVSSAQIAKMDRPLSRIAVADIETGQLVVEVE